MRKTSNFRHGDAEGTDSLLVQTLRSQWQTVKRKKEEASAMNGIQTVHSRTWEPPAALARCPSRSLHRVQINSKIQIGIVQLLRAPSPSPNTSQVRLFPSKFRSFLTAFTEQQVSSGSSGSITSLERVAIKAYDAQISCPRSSARGVSGRSFLKSTRPRK